MQPAENKDYSRDVILRLSPTRNTIIVEEQKPGGIAAYREIDPLELYYVINQSYASNDYSLSYLSPCGNISKTRRFSRRRAVSSAAGRRSGVWRNALPI